MNVRIESPEIEQHPLWRQVICRIADIPRLVVPERTLQTDDIAIIVCQGNYGAFASPQRKEIHISLSTVEAVHHLAAASWIFRKDYDCFSQNGDTSAFSANNACAFECYDEAKKLLVGGDGLPLGRAVDEVVDLTYQALAFYIFHEIAHIVLRHTASNDEINIELESDADTWALNHLLTHPEISIEDLALRAWGCCTGLVAICIRDLHQIERAARAAIGLESQ